MTRQQIEPLMQLLQRSEGSRTYYDPWSSDGRSSLINAPNTGLLAAREIARTGNSPEFLQGEEYRYVCQAASQFAGKVENTPLALAVERALDLHADELTSGIVEALLLSRDYDPDLGAEILGEGAMVISAYESLVFNVRARWDELAYIRQVIARSGNERLLRVGFNGLMLDVLQHAGLGGYASDDVLQTSEELLQRIRQSALASAASWAASGSSKPVSRLAACGLAIVQRQADVQAVQTPQSTLLSDSIRADLDRTRQSMVKALSDQIEARSWQLPPCPYDDPTQVETPTPADEATQQTD